MTEAYLSFCAFCAEDFESFLLEFQFEELVIHNLYDGMLTLLANLMKKYIKKKSLFKANEDLKTNKDLLENDVSRAANHKLLNCVETGTETRLYFNECVSLVRDEVLKFRRECLKFYSTAREYLMKNLPVDSALVKCAYFHQNLFSAKAIVKYNSNLKFGIESYKGTKMRL